MTASLSVNINAIAMLRNRRDLPWPNLIGLGRIALAAGASGLTVHPRPDERHIRFSDLPAIRALIDDEFPQAEFNIEGYPTREFLDLVAANEPEQVTLVPDDPAQSTSDHGWDLERDADFLRPIITDLKRQAIRVSLFVDADPEAPAAAKMLGADRIELYTGPYGGAHDDPIREANELEKLEITAKAAAKAGIAVNAGHDLTVENLPALVKKIPNLVEVSIGHGLTADALVHGMAGAVGRYLNALQP
ncbi:pyridoxine 5'-phosphate synthase [Phyllobacterium endophyticum]|uniref:Pyridoxine 5'-phosphate synthase n=1 Tax=Phyllobacterium endophyticum TaxID=1149773 RepID=A0A2P7ANE7_9HYPH|nr:pyridoxine 5'-phosphate synthase [Phyllobacterium endophyticum]MBB3233987.1 pyridoxine 5-phosphate synthase [Phyllobacterium endophyticum]PSH55715.1 pyridoxine 5'-phosphate synthase [Phyllobacterium endophyticum]TYR43765.1 pyridoxine 5'-phosphate synthase [Phyllobacterium endophyticum]